VLAPVLLRGLNLLCSNVAKMTDDQKRKRRFLELIALLVCTAVLWAVLFGNSRTGGGYVRVGPKTYLFTVDSNGFPQLDGVALANPRLRNGVFRIIGLLGGEVELNLPRVWMKNPVVKSNVWNASEAINRFGLSPAAKIVRERNKLERPDMTNFPSWLANGVLITSVTWSRTIEPKNGLRSIHPIPATNVML
jgi:hypothetical protein